MLALLIATMLGRADGQAMKTGEGVGVLASAYESPKATLEVKAATVNSAGRVFTGEIVAHLVMPDTIYRYFGVNEGWRVSFVSYASISIYSQSFPGGEDGRLVFAGVMKQITPAASSNLDKPSRHTASFSTRVGTSPGGINLDLAPGNYRAEVEFRVQETRSVNGIPDPKAWSLPVAGAAIEFSVGRFVKTAMVDVRGGINVSALITPKKGATVAQIDQLRAAASRAHSAKASEVKSFVAAEASISDYRPERLGWLYEERSQRRANSLEANFRVYYGESYLSKTSELNKKLRDIVKSGNFAKTLPGGSYKIVTSSSLQMHRR